TFDKCFGNATKLVYYTEECARLGIKVLPPHVNSSEKSFTVADDNIRYGLLAIKNLGSAVIDKMITERKMNGDFKNFESFCRRMQGKDMNKRAVESLIKSGALDDLGNNRREMFLNMPSVIDSLDSEKRNNIEGQIGFFNLVEEEEKSHITKAEDYSDKQKLSMEKEVTGMYLSGHPMSAFKAYYDSGKIARIDKIIDSSAGDIHEYQDEQFVDLIAIVSSVKKKQSRNGANMAFATVEDMYASIEILVFPTVYERYSNLIATGKEVKIHGKISFTEEKEPKIICDYLIEATEENIGKAQVKSKNKGLYIKIFDDKKYEKALKYIEVFEGYTELFVYFDKTKKLMKAPSKYKLDPNPVLIRELKKILGEENVVLKK
ncbi:MAG: OB-fold nucleic acid binding domain-containing protein, partial [Clostridia bacterium]